VRSGGGAVQQLEQIVRQKLDLLVAPLGCAVVAGDEATGLAVGRGRRRDAARRGIVFVVLIGNGGVPVGSAESPSLLLTEFCTVG